MQPKQTPAQTAPAPPLAQDDVIRVSTELVQTGVTVVDKQGRFVDGLDRDKFELRVNGKEQPVAFFARVVAGSNKEFALLTNRNRPTPARENEQPASPPAGSAAVERGRTTFLFIDDMHLSASSMTRTKELLLNFVDNLMGPKDQAV